MTRKSNEKKDQIQRELDIILDADQLVTLSSDTDPLYTHDYPPFPTVEAGLILRWADQESQDAEFAVNLTPDTAAYFLDRYPVEVLAVGNRRSLVGLTSLSVALLKNVDEYHKAPVRYLNKADKINALNIPLFLLLKSLSAADQINKAIEICESLDLRTPTQSQLGELVGKDPSTVSKILKRRSS